MRVLRGFFLGCLLCMGVKPLIADWELDFDQQRPSKRASLESRYQSAARDEFLMEADRYAISLGLGPSKGHQVSFISLGNEKVIQNGCFEIQDALGRVWKSSASASQSRINLYRRGPYYHEVHWMDVSWTHENKEMLPIKGEVVWYCYPYTFRIGLILHATDALVLEKVSFHLGASDSGGRRLDREEYSSSLLIATSDDEPVSAWFPTIPPFCQWREKGAGEFALEWPLDKVQGKLNDGEILELGCGFIPVSRGGNVPHWRELKAQLQPLDTSRLKLIEGLNFIFDPLRGDYVVSSHNPGGFNYHYYEDPNGYLLAKMQISNNEMPRRIYIRHQVGTGSKGQVECGVVLDEQGEVVPIQVQISKNFAGEKEEKFYNPQYTPFSEIIFPVHLGDSERRVLTSMQLYQNWGNHPLKQFSSLGAWMDYFHMSTGVTETTCYVPFKFYTGISIADLRGMSGRMWESQPQHDNVGGHVFMEYQPMDLPGKTAALEYLGTQFHSTGPNWAHATLSYLSSDKRLHFELETFEYPQVDELRNFIRIRLKALEDIPIKDWAREFRLMQIDTRTQSLRYQNVTWTDPTGNAVTRKIKFDNTWTLLAEPLHKKAPAAILWNSPKGNNAFIVEDWRGTMGGKPVTSLGVSCEGRATGDSNLVLHPLTDAGGLKKGDTFEVDLFIMPFGKEGTDFKPALIERQRYGLNPIEIKILSKGEVASSFPPHIRWIENDLEFTVKGGYSTVALTVSGLPDFKNWKLQKWVDGQWEAVLHAHPGARDVIQGEGLQKIVCEDGSFGVIFRIDLDGSIQRFRVINS